VHGHFDAVFVQGGSTGTVRAMMDARHPFVPIAGEAENGFRKLIAQHAKEGLKGISIGQSSGLVAISIKAAITALQGNPMPRLDLAGLDPWTVLAGSISDRPRLF
jgi:ribose transport system substrate-binding protein